MSIPYNPFELLTLIFLKNFQRNKQHLLVIQRFNWPGIPAGRGFMVTPYFSEKTARQHQATLDAKEGRLVNLYLEMDIVIALLNSSKYLLFVSSFREMRWNTRVLTYYQKNISSFLRAKNLVGAGDQPDIELMLEYGKLKAAVRSAGTTQIFDAYDLITAL